MDINNSKSNTRRNGSVDLQVFEMLEIGGLCDWRVDSMLWEIELVC